MSPQIIFTAHEHKALHISLDTASDQLSDIWKLPPHKTPLYQLRLDMGDVHEIQIPTCSYRMGTSNMGYGLAYIGNKQIIRSNVNIKHMNNYKFYFSDTQEKILDFTILWSPDRFSKLLIYPCIILFSFLFLLCSICYRSRVNYTRVPI